ncbi:DUF3221 domain-containing protein [Bacillus aerolatus]|uniref:DUF3221 domain-containing protein n=1 Tax=Bacillus aerolatus TaxID=2653354 RepID=UPI0017836CE0|nr:DUF3221 domain-containing protein [Bacillus aerolatus]
MKIKLLFIILCIPLLFLAACSSDSQTQKESTSANENDSVKEKAQSKEYYVTTGYIVRKDERHIRVMPKITKEELMGKNEEALEALLREKYDGQGVSFRTADMDAINEKTISALHVGQKVVIKHDMYGLSAPAYGGHALEIRIVEE